MARMTVAKQRLSGPSGGDAIFELTVRPARIAPRRRYVSATRTR
jgi:hypothetical protein